MAEYNTSTLIDSIITQSKDTDFSRSLVLDFVQRTQDLVLGRQRFKFLESTEQAVLSTGDTTYEYESDHQEVIKLILVDYTTTLPTIYQPHYLAPNEFFDLYPSPEDNTKNPAFNYTDFNGQIVFPAPLNKPYTIKMQSISRPNRLEDLVSSFPQIPVEYQDILIRGGLAGIEQFRENFDIAALHERKVEDLTEDLQGRYGPRKVGPGKSRTRGLSYGNSSAHYGNQGITNGTF